ncbi:MAG: hypothetical protein ACTS82_04600 [Arsenophonus sp. ET-DL12-MAG3]
MYDLPSMKHVKKVVIDEMVVSGQSEPLVIYSQSHIQVSAEK